ncbi:MAG: hypothetical protein JKX76_02905 [Colwellia sp.]|nr:hypothetical protein [Colwellia sp.]
MVGKLGRIDYSICRIAELESIGKQLSHPEFKLDSFLDKLGGIIAQVIGDLGVKTLPDKAGQQRIAHYIINYFGDFNTEEIKMAFELAIVGELDVDAEHYNSFEPKFVSKVLIAFRKKKRAAKIKLRQVTETYKPKEISEEERKRIRHEYIQTICKAYEKYSNGGEFILYDYRILYNILIEDEILYISEQRWVELTEAAKVEYKKRLTKPSDEIEKSTFKKILSSFPVTVYSTHLDKVKAITKELAVKYLIKDCKENGVNLPDLFIQKSGHDE